MSHAFDRTRRVADLIQHELAKLLIKEVRDPRFVFVTVTAVEVSRDYSYAKVYVSVLEESKIKETVAALNKAAGFFRYQLAHSINMRTTPKLHFVYDESIERGRKLSDLLRGNTSNLDPSEPKE